MASELISLGILFAGAVLGGLIAARLKQPAVIGLLLVGAIIGPKALNIVQDTGMIEKVAEFGAILLLFVIGLEFVIPKLMKIGAKALMLSFLKIGIVFFITYQTLFWFGFGAKNAVLLGVIISLSSTVVIVKILQSKNLYQKQEMPLIIAVLIFEDIFSVFVLTFLANSGGGSILGIVQHLVISISALLAAYLIMLKMSRGIVTWFAKAAGEEGMTYTALAMCAGFSALAYVLGLSPSIGAFLAGSVIASLPDAKRFEESIRPYAGMFTSLFFISIGTMVDPNVVASSMNVLLILLGLVIATRFIGVGFIGYLFANFKKEQIIFTSIAMIAVSEFALLVAKEASHLAPELDLVSIAAALVFLTALLFSFTVSSYERMFSIVDGFVPRSFRNHSGRLSDYIRLTFDEIDTENTHTSKFKLLLLKIVLYSLAITFAFIGFGHGMRLLDGSPIGVRILVFLAFTALVVFLGHKMYMRAKSAYHSLATILAGLEAGRSIRKSQYILDNLIAVLLLVSLIFMLPLLTVLFKLPLYAVVLMNLAPVGVLCVVFFHLRRISRALSGFSNTRELFPRYKKVSERNYLFQKSAQEE
jgi:Kef-type K+ transport system membrane component KefB